VVRDDPKTKKDAIRATRCGAMDGDGHCSSLMPPTSKCNGHKKDCLGCHVPAKRRLGLRARLSSSCLQVSSARRQELIFKNDSKERCDAKRSKCLLVMILAMGLVAASALQRGTRSLRR